MNGGLILYLPGLLLFVGGIGFVIANLILSHILHPHVRTHEKYTTYECGEDPIGNAWVQFNHRFYLIALIFVIFDVEIILMFPWVLAFRDFGWFGFVDLVIFLAILVIGLAYAWVKGALVWDKPRPRYTSAAPVSEQPISDRSEDSHAAVA